MLNPIDSKHATNKQSLLKTLFFEGPLSYQDICQRQNLSMPKILSLVTELRNENKISESGQGLSSGGRRPVLIGLADNAFYLIGISIGFDKTSVGIMNSQCTLIGQVETLTGNVLSDIQLFDTIGQTIQALIESHHIDSQRIIAIGLEMPGIIDSQQQINRSYFIGFNWHSLSEKWGYPVYIENDTKVRMFWERSFGLAKSLNHVLLVHADEGIGLGMIVNGQLYSGKNGFAGEFGHLPLQHNGKLCRCGKYGCLESIASSQAITEQAKQGLKSGTASLLTSLSHKQSENIDIELVVQAALAGDQFSLSLLAEAAFWLGRGIALLIQLFNPERIILSGHLVEVAPFVLPSIQQAINTFANPITTSETDIVMLQPRTQTCVTAPAAIAFYKLFLPQ